MKLRYITLVGFWEEDETFHYLYALYGTSFLKAHYFLLHLSSHLPHFLWTEIQNVMVNEGVYFEDLIDAFPCRIPIGTISVKRFSISDSRVYGPRITGWQTFLTRALETQKEYTDRHIENHGRTDLTGTGFLSDYDPNKEW